MNAEHDQQSREIGVCQEKKADVATASAEPIIAPRPTDLDTAAQLKSAAPKTRPNRARSACPVNKIEEFGLSLTCLGATAIGTNSVHGNLGQQKVACEEEMLREEVNHIEDMSHSAILVNSIPCTLR